MKTIIAIIKYILAALLNIIYSLFLLLGVIIGIIRFIVTCTIIFAWEIGEKVESKLIVEMNNFLKYLKPKKND